MTERKESVELNNLQERGELSPAPLRGENEAEPLGVSLRSLGGKRCCLRGDSNFTSRRLNRDPLGESESRTGDK